MNQNQKNYSKEFKSDAVNLAKRSGINEVSEKLGVHPSTLRKWRRALDVPDGGSSKPSVEELKKRNQQLEKEIGYLKKINEVLKKSTAIFSNTQMPPF